MKYRARNVGSAFGALVLIIAGALSAAPEPKPDPGAEALRLARRRLELRDYEGALRQLRLVPAGSRFESAAATTAATCWLAKAMIADNATEVTVSALSLTGHTGKVLRSLDESSPGDAFLSSVQPLLNAYKQGAGRDFAERWVGSASTSIWNCLDQARLEARRGLSKSQTADEKARAHVGLAWSSLYRFLVSSEASALRAQLELAGLLQKPAEQPAQATRGGDPGRSRAEAELRGVLAESIGLARNSASPDQPLATAECLALYCVEAGRFQAGTFPATFARFNSLPRRDIAFTDTVAAASDTPPRDPAAVLGSVHLSNQLAAAPEMLLVPLFALALRLDTKHENRGAPYGLYLALLRFNEKSAMEPIEAWSKQHPGDAAFALERARFEARSRKDVPAATLAVLEAARAPSLSRPMYGSLPLALQPSWFASRHASRLTPVFAFGYLPILALIDRQAAGPTDPPTPASVQQTALRLRLAQLLMTSNLRPDVLLGLKEAQRSLSMLSRLPLSDEEKAQLELCRRQIDADIRKIPPIPAELRISAKGVEVPTIADTARLSYGPSFPSIVIYPDGGGAYFKSR